MFETKFGFYMTSYETFKKLKELHKWYWNALYDFHRWYRWNRKQPQNRFGTKPSYCSLFVLDTTWYRTTIKQNGHTRVKYFPKTVTDYGIIELYQLARMPHKEPVKPFSKEIVDKINQLHSKLIDWKQNNQNQNQEKDVKIAS